jgi:hypothetical protein
VSEVTAAPAFPYYLSDFDSVIEGVEQRYAALLNADERAYIARLKSLSLPARMLYVRLVNRKGPYFRVARLDYPEIGALDAAIAELLAHGLLEICVTAPHPKRRLRLLSCFTLPELRAWLKAHPITAGRPALLDWLAAWDDCSIWLQDVLQAQPVIGLPESDPWPFLRFLFFGELRDNLSDFVVRALGHIVTESVDATALRPLFTRRVQADDANRMACLYRHFSETRDGKSAMALLEWWRGHAIERQDLQDGHAWFDRFIDRLGRRLERENQPAAALELYADSPVAPARERRARLLIKAGRKAEATSLLQTMAAAPCHPEEAYAARQLLARLEKNARQTEAWQFQRINRTLDLPYTPRAGFGDTATNVETAVLNHYRARGWQGVHAENWLWNASFGLLLWDIIYDPALGGFHSPLQFAPADLYGPDFYSRRQQAIETRLEFLRTPRRAFEIAAGHFAAKQGIANPFVAWHEDLPDILEVMLQRVPADGHAAVLRRMARNPRHHAHGFLDLFIWNDSNYRFIEIKGENDRLAGHQFEWLRFFAEAGINVSLEQVRRPVMHEEGGKR